VTVNERDWLAERFESNRTHLRAVAYRMLGSVTEADDAVQETWLRLSRTEPGAVDNLRGWLTTVIGRVCIDMLRARTARREEPITPHLPEPIVTTSDTADPEQQALVADAVGLALLVVLDTLGPAERLAFVLHDMFGVPFDEIAPIVDRSPAAARKLASRARQRVRLQPAPETDVTRQRVVVDAFLAAARAGDFEALVAVLAPDVTLRSDLLGVAVVHGAEAVARGALGFTRLAEHAQRVLVNGTAGLVAAPDGRPRSILAFTITDGRITEIDVVADPERVRSLDLQFHDGWATRERS
jgi:RNA polymerase sigma factor (sigma-70 family)